MRIHNKNIMQLYIENNKVVPFRVRRESWPEGAILLITDVILDGKGYGSAKGYLIGSVRGYSSDYWGIPGRPKEISCAGCYQWIMVV